MSLLQFLYVVVVVVVVVVVAAAVVVVVAIPAVPPEINEPIPLQ